MAKMLMGEPIDEFEVAYVEGLVEARQRDRQRLRAALRDRRRWRGKSILLRKHWFRLGDKLTKLKAERDEARGGRNLRRKEAKEYWDRLKQACRWSAAWKAAAKEWRDKAKVKCGSWEEWKQVNAEVCAERDELRKKHELTANNRDGWRARAFKTEKERDELQAELDRRPTMAVLGAKADECHLLREMLHEMEAMRDTAVIQRDELRRRLEEARELLDGWQIDGELWAVGYEELKQLAAALRGEEANDENSGAT